MLLSLKDDDDEVDDEMDDDNKEEVDDELQQNARYVKGARNANNDNIDSAVQQTVLAYDEHDFFGTHNHLIAEPTFTNNGHVNPQITTTMSAATLTMTPARTTSSLLNTHISRVLTSASLSNTGGSGEFEDDVKANIDEIIEKSSSSNKTLTNSQQHYISSNSPHSAGNSRTNSPAPRRQQNNFSATNNPQATSQRLFSSNILPSNLRQDSYHDDADEICLVPEVDFECSSIMEHCTDNRESQPLLGGNGGTSSSAGGRDHFDMPCNTFVGKFLSFLLSFIASH